MGSAKLRQAVCVLIALSLILVGGCAARRVPAQPPRDVTKTASAEFAVPGPAAPPLASRDAGLLPSVTIYELPERKIIKQGEMNLEVLDVGGAVESVESLAKEMGGYISDLSVSAPPAGKKAARVTARVPALRFDEFVREVAKLGNETHKHTFTSDVTEEFIDLEARLANLEGQEKRLRELLAKADKVSDVIEVERELARVRGEIDSLSGRLRYLRNRVEFSTLAVTLVETPLAGAGVSTRGMGGVWGRGAKAFVRTINAFVNGLAGFIVFLFGAAPVLVVLGVAAWGAWSLRRRFVARKANRTVGA